MSQLEPLVSIIVPVYNCVDYISECIESIISQTYRCIELLLINDGSSDGSEKICDNFSKKYNYIKVINKNNGGAGSARNVGLDNAIGDYIMFVDGDDTILPNMISELVELIRTTNSDVVGSYIYKKKHENNNVKSYSSKEALIALLHSKLDCSQCTKLFKSEILQQIRFPEGIINEDVIFLIDVYANINKLSYINKNYYYYRYNNNGVTKKGDSLIAVAANINVIKKKINGYFIDLKDDLAIYECEKLSDICIIINRNKLRECYNVLYQQARKRIITNWQILLHKKFPLRYKCKMLLAILKS